MINEVAHWLTDDNQGSWRGFGRNPPPPPPADRVVALEASILRQRMRRLEADEKTDVLRKAARAHLTLRQTSLHRPPSGEKSSFTDARTWNTDSQWRAGRCTTYRETNRIRMESNRCINPEPQQVVFKLCANNTTGLSSAAGWALMFELWTITWSLSLDDVDGGNKSWQSPDRSGSIISSYFP